VFAAVCSFKFGAELFEIVDLTHRYNDIIEYYFLYSILYPISFVVFVQK